MSAYKYEPDCLEQLREDGPPVGSLGQIVPGLFKPARGLAWFSTEKKTFLVSVKSLTKINEVKKARKLTNPNK